MALKKALSQALGRSVDSVANPTTANLTPQQVQSMYGTGSYGFQSAQNAGTSGTTGLYGQAAPLVGYQQPTFAYQPINIDKKVFKTPAQQQAEITRQAAMQERQASLQRNQSLAGTILQGYEQAIGNNRAFSDRYGQSQRDVLDRQRTQQLAEANQSAISRGLGNTTIRDSLGRGVQSNYDQARIGLEDQLAAQSQARENALTTSRLGFLQSINDPAMSFSDVANYAQQPNAVRAAEASAKAAQQQASSANRTQLLSSLAGIGGAALGGPLGGVVGGAVGSMFAKKPTAAPAAVPNYNYGYTPFNPYALS